MNQTNRALNRTVLLVVGIILLVLGAAVVAVFVWPPAADYWSTGTAATGDWMEQAIAATTIPASTASWAVIGILALILLLVILLIVVLTRIGGGRSRTVLRSTGADNPLGRVRINDAFASDALKTALGERDEILFSSISAHEVKREPVMQVNVTPRQNTSPRDVVEDVDHLVSNLSSLTGRSVPTYISLRSGLRAKLAADQQRVS